MRKLALLTSIALLGTMAANAEVVFFDDFSSYDGGSIWGDVWKPKWDGSTNLPYYQRDLMTATNGVMTLDTSRAYRNYNCPNSTGFTVVSNLYIVTDVQYEYAGGGNIASNFNKAAFGVNFDTTPNWWNGTKKGNAIANRGGAIGNTLSAAPWIEGWQTHSSLGVNTANAENSNWFKIATKLIASNDTVWIQNSYYAIDDTTLSSPISEGFIQDTGVSNSVTLYASYNTSWNDVGATNTIESFSKFSKVNYDNFFVGTKDAYENALLSSLGYEPFYNWEGSLSDFWAPHTLYGHGGTDKLNNWGYWFQTTNAAYADPQNKFMQHRPGLVNDPATSDKEGGSGWRGQFMKDYPARGTVTGETYEVSFDIQLFANGLENARFLDCFFSTNNISTNSALSFGTADDELGFVLRQNPWSNSPESTNGNFTVGFDPATENSHQWSTSVTNLGITVVDQGAGTDLDGDNLFVTYTALKTTNAPLFECKLAISNKVTGATFDSGAVLVSNATAYAAENLYLCFYTSDDLSNGTSDGSNSGGYEIDNVNGRITFFKPEPLTGYAAFAELHNLVGGPYDDDDNDGIDNVTEYALNGDPNVDAASDTGIVLPYMEYKGSYTDYFHVQLTDPNADITYVWEHTDNLAAGPWSTSEIVPTNYPHATEGLQQYRRRAWLDTATEHFFRLKVTQD